MLLQQPLLLEMETEVVQIEVRVPQIQMDWLMKNVRQYTMRTQILMVLVAEESLMPQDLAVRVKVDIKK